MGFCRWRMALFLLLAGTSMLQAEPAVETVLERLKNPVAVALQPETGVIFIAEGGAGRVVRVVEGQAEEGDHRVALLEGMGEDIS